MALFSFSLLTALSLLGGSRAQTHTGATKTCTGAAQTCTGQPPASYVLTIVPQKNIQTCRSATFTFTIAPPLNKLTAETLGVSIESVNRTFSQVLSTNAVLDDYFWSWSDVVVPTAGQYRLAIASGDKSQYQISGLSPPFSISAVDKSCLSFNSVSSTPPTPTGNINGLSHGALAGTATGSVVGFFFIIAICLAGLRRRRTYSQAELTPTYTDVVVVRSYR